MQNKFLIMLFGLVLFCGKAQALPQNWPCDEYVLYPIEKIEDPTDKEDSVYKFQGKKGDYQVTVSKFDIDEPLAYCGNHGCFETIKNLKTGEEENLYFECLPNKDKMQISCWIIDEDEVLLHKVSDDEYRVEWCGGEYYDYLKYSECTGCICTLKDSRPKGSTDRDRHCRREGDNLRCFNFEGYGRWRNFEDKPGDWVNCVGLGI